LRRNDDTKGSMSIYINIFGKETLPPVDDRQYFRVPRDVERMDVNANNFRVRTGTRGPVRQVVIDKNLAQPEVYRLLPAHHVVLDCAFQRLWRALNPKLSDEKWSSLLGNGLAWTNQTGFPGRFNCVTGADKGKLFPRFDQPRLCSNAVVSGRESNNYLWLDTMLTTNPAMKAADVMRTPHYWYYGTSVNAKGETNFITRLGMDGARHKVIIPVLTSQPVYLPLNELVRI